MNALKMVGLLLIVLTGVCAGLYSSTELSRRASSLERIGRLIEYIETQIRYTAAPVKEIIAKTASVEEFGALSFLQTACAGVQNGERPDTAWRGAVQSEGENCGFNATDRELLFDFGAELGKSDVEGQLSHCESFHRLFEDRLQSARSDVRIKGKLYVTLGVTAGLGVALLLL